MKRMLGAIVLALAVAVPARSDGPAPIGRRGEAVADVTSDGTAGVRQDPAGAEAGERSDVELLVESWFDRWNALDGSSDTTEAFVDLYRPDALHTTGPSSHQLGTVVFRGHAAITKMASDFARRFEKQAFRIETVTANEESVQLFNTTIGPWGGASVAVEYVGAFTSREDGARFVHPGAIFFQILDGKIHRARVYMATGELAEVEPEVQRRRR